MDALLFSRFVYKATYCGKVPSTLSDVIRVLFVLGQQFSKVHTSDDTFILRSPRKQHLSELMIEISVFKNAGYRCLNAFCRCKIIVFLNQLGVCRQQVCALCFAESSCAVPWWPLDCLNTLTLGSQAGCWGVRSGSPPGVQQRLQSVSVSVSCQSSFLLKEQYRGGGLKKNSVIHQSACWRSKTALNIPFCAGKVLLTGAQCTDWSTMTPQPLTIVLCPEAATGCLITCWVGWGAYDVYPVLLSLIMNINVVMCWEKVKINRQTLVFHPHAFGKLLPDPCAYRKYFFLSCLFGCHLTCVTFVIIVVVVGIISLALTLLDSLHMVGCGQDHF